MTPMIHMKSVIEVIFQQLDCDWVAADDYEYFITQCPDDPAAELLKLQVKVLTEQSPVFH